MKMSLVKILLATLIAVFATQMLGSDEVLQSSGDRCGCLDEKERRALSSWKLKIPRNSSPCGASVNPINSYSWAAPECPVLCLVKTSKSHKSHPSSITCVLRSPKQGGRTASSWLSTASLLFAQLAPSAGRPFTGLLRREHTSPLPFPSTTILRGNNPQFEVNGVYWR